MLDKVFVPDCKTNNRLVLTSQELVGKYLLLGYSEQAAFRQIKGGVKCGLLCRREEFFVINGKNVKIVFYEWNGGKE